jgi:acetoin utilization deacetylase AcuC-like enzyme
MTELFTFYYPQGHEAHYHPQHPERPERVEAIREAFIQAGYWGRFSGLEAVAVPEKVMHGVHLSYYLDQLKDACRKSLWLDADTFLVPASWELALQTAGGAVAVGRQVWERNSSTGFALCRPPGHHATPDKAMGFCLLNNVAVCAEDLIQNYGARRIAILDFDLHHGNGTQDIFWEREEVFYLSTHQWPLYPGTGRLTDRGAGNGLGKTANIPFPPGTGDEGFLTCLNEIFIPLLERYEPEMLLISVGFDSHWMDPLGYLQLSSSGYHQLIKQLNAWAKTHCQGRIALVLEGGYDLEAISECSLAVVTALLDEPFEDRLGPPRFQSDTRWKNILRQARELWQVQA